MDLEMLNRSDEAFSLLAKPGRWIKAILIAIFFSLNCVQCCRRMRVSIRRLHQKVGVTLVGYFNQFGVRSKARSRLMRQPRCCKSTETTRRFSLSLPPTPTPSRPYRPRPPRSPVTVTAKVVSHHYRTVTSTATIKLPLYSR